MTEAETTAEVVVDPEDDGFSGAVRTAVRPLVWGIVALVAVVSIAGGITIGALVVQASGIIHARSEGRAYTCAGDQYFELHHNSLVQTDQDVWRTLLADSAKTKPAEQRPAIRQYADGIVGRYEETKVPVRACSPAAIRAYIEWRTAHPNAVECPYDARGYCTSPPTTNP